MARRQSRTEDDGFSLFGKESNNETCFIVAGIGQNHQGDIKIAKKLVDAAKEAGANCVKFQKSDLPSRFTPEVLMSDYDSPNSFGATYGEHRKHLEFSEDQLRELKFYCDKVGIMFFCSAMDLKSFDFLLSMGLKVIKIGSADCTNLLLYRHAEHLNVSLIISTGMTTGQELDIVYKKLLDYNIRFAFLQCTSSYPTEIKDSHLNVMSKNFLRYKQAVIGYSGHERGYDITVTAAALGAQIVERHITLDKTQKGSNHQCSLEPQEFKIMVKAIRSLKEAKGSPSKNRLTCELSCLNKLGKTIVAKRDLAAGEILAADMLAVKSSKEVGFRPISVDAILGRKVLTCIKKDQTILKENVEIPCITVDD